MKKVVSNLCETGPAPIGPPFLVSCEGKTFTDKFILRSRVMCSTYRNTDQPLSAVRTEHKIFDGWRDQGLFNNSPCHAGEHLVDVLLASQ